MQQTLIEQAKKIDDYSQREVEIVQLEQQLHNSQQEVQITQERMTKLEQSVSEMAVAEDEAEKVGSSSISLLDSIVIGLE